MHRGRVASLVDRGAFVGRSDIISALLFPLSFTHNLRIVTAEVVFPLPMRVTW